MWNLPYPIATLGTVGVIILAFIVHYAGGAIIQRRSRDNPHEAYRRRKFLTTIIAMFAAVAIAIFWARLLHQKSTFFGLLGAGLAIALREPLLSIAGRIAIFAGHMYSVGDRIEINKMAGDVIDIGFFYTRMMEIGNWVQADQASGRIVQFSNASVFGTPVFNYTQNFSYLWDEVRLPITYASNVKEATKILLRVGAEYTGEFLSGAKNELQQMQRAFLVPSVELKPNVFMKVTDNWVELTLRYLVQPKQRRAASTFIFQRVFDEVQKREDIAIASTTAELTIHRPKEGMQGGEKAA